MKTFKNTKKIALAAFAFTAAVSSALAETPASAEENEASPYSLSVEGVYGKALKKASRGGVDAAGLDIRLNYAVDESNKFNLGLLMLGGSENIGAAQDLETGNFGILAGYRAAFPLVENRVNVYAGIRAGLAYVNYTLDAGRFDGWDHYRSDSDFCAVYAGEIGIAYSFSEKWSVRGGYEFYGTTATIGGGDMKFGEQQYHLFQLGAEYRF